MWGAKTATRQQHDIAPLGRAKQDLERAPLLRNSQSTKPRPWRRAPRVSRSSSDDKQDPSTIKLIWISACERDTRDFASPGFFRRSANGLLQNVSAVERTPGEQRRTRSCV
jgi:hypothetical protein